MAELCLGRLVAHGICEKKGENVQAPSKSPKRDTPRQIEPNAQNRYEVTPADLPLCCPMPGMSLWNSHPRVYLPLEELGEAKCPYCGAEFTLKL